VGGLEREVVVVCFLPADGLKDPAEITKPTQIWMNLRFAAVSIQSRNSASNFNFTSGEGV